MKKTALLICSVLSAGMLLAQNDSDEKTNEKKIETIKIVDGDTVVHDVRLISEDDIKQKREMRMRMDRHQRMHDDEMPGEWSDEMDEILEDLDIYVNVDDRKKKMIVRKMMMHDDDMEDILKSFDEDEDLLLEMTDGKREMKVIKISIDEEDGEEVKVVEMRKEMREERMEEDYDDRREMHDKRRKREDPLKVFPNPANNELNLTFKVMEGKPAELTIMDMDGEKVFNKTYKSAGEIKETVDLKGKEKGMYVVRLMDVNRTISKTIIVE